MLISLLMIVGLCWGSFLNVVAYRLIFEYSLLGRSFCDHCKEQIAIYDLVPIISFCILRGSCRNCKNPISLLYPLIEFLTALVFGLVVLLMPPSYWLSYWIFFSSLIVTIRMDIESMLISEILTLGFIPLGMALSYFGYLPISLINSVLGAILGYLILFCINKIFYTIKNQQAIGEGDFDLLAMIGAFLGPIGVLHSLFLGSIFGSVVGIYFIWGNKSSLDTKLPFGPWLSFGAIIYVLFKSYINFF